MQNFSLLLKRKKHSRVRSLNLILLVSAFLFASLQTYAQAPSSFTYPTPVTYSANLSNVFLSPNVAGNISSYSMPSTPALPAGLTFNPNTGVISGTPTAALPATDYVITANNSSGSASTTLRMTVINSYLPNNNGAVSFKNSSASFVYPAGSNGRQSGNIVLFSNVVTIEGQSVDCIVTTRNVQGLNTWTAYDQDAASGSGFDSNDERFFSPQFNFASGGGSATFDFQFITHGSYNASTRTGTNVTLQNVRLNTYDIDGNGNNNSNQFNEFGGFLTSELGRTPTVAASYNATTGLTKFRSTSTVNSTTITAPATRVRVSYANMSSFSIVVGAEANGAAYFFLDFSAGPNFTSDLTTAPSVDLHTGQTGVNNDGAGCQTDFKLTVDGQTNIAVGSGSAINALEVSYKRSTLRNASGEQLYVSGATAGTSEQELAFSSGSTSSVTVGDVAYTITKSVATVGTETVNKLAFAKTGGGTITLAQAEALLDALHYRNVAEVPVGGQRQLVVNVLNSTYKSPDAIYSATVNCVSIAGHVWKDGNGLLGSTDFNTISFNAPAGGQFADNSIYALLLNVNTGAVLQSVGIQGGAYSFGTVAQGPYQIVLSTQDKAAGEIVTTATLPDGFTSVGENLGAGAGSDLLNDGKLLVTVGSEAITNANFGLNSAPTANDVSETSRPNPGFANQVQVPVLNGADHEEGTLNGNAGNTILITSLPTNGVLYYNGTAIDLTITDGSAGSAKITNYDPSKLTIDPNDGDVTVVFTYKEIDAAGFESNNATVTLPFYPVSISGNVFHDANGLTPPDGKVDGTGINSVDGAALYANLYTEAGQFILTTTVGNDGTYKFDNIAPNTNYIVTTGSVAGSNAVSAQQSADIPGAWVNTGEHIGTGAGSDLNANGMITVAVAATNVEQVNFGLEQAPFADSKLFVIQSSAFSQTPAGGVAVAGYFGLSAASNTLTGYATGGSLSGSDAEDCAAAGSCNTGKTFQINTVRDNTRLYYDGVEIGADKVITNFDNTKLFIYGQTGSSGSGDEIGFTYSLIDEATVKNETPATYIIRSSPLPVKLVRFQVQKQETAAVVSWTTSEEINSDYFEVQRSRDGSKWEALEKVTAKGQASTVSEYTFTDAAPIAGLSYYRLKMVDRDRTLAYSGIRNVTFEGAPELTLYPNPVSTKLYMNNTGSFDKIEVYDMSGRLVKTYTLIKNELDLTPFTAGTYLFKFSAAGGNAATRRIYIKHD